MKKIKVLVVIAGLSLALLCVVQAGAKVPIQGWDKARFGMSPQQLRQAYEEGAKYLDEFWEEYEEMEGMSSYRLATTRLKILTEEAKPTPTGQELSDLPSYTTGSKVFFHFVDDKLSKIVIYLSVQEVAAIYLLRETAGGEIEEASHAALLIESAETAHKGFNAKLKQLAVFLASKYGDYAIGETGSSATWEDARGNVLNLQVAGEAFRYQGKDYALIGGCTIIYYDRKLTNQWDEQVAEWVEKRDTYGQVGMENF